MAGVAERLKAALPGWAVFDAPPVRGGVPYAVVEEPVLADWSGTAWGGREGRLAVTLADAGERPARLRGGLAAAERALETMPAALGDRWRILTLTLARSRLQRGSGDRWTGTAEFRVRMFRLDA